MAPCLNGKTGKMDGVIYPWFRGYSAVKQCPIPSLLIIQPEPAAVKNTRQAAHEGAWIAR
jgi:hypothetical protein